MMNLMVAFLEVDSDKHFIKRAHLLVSASVEAPCEDQQFFVAGPGGVYRKTRVHHIFSLDQLSVPDRNKQVWGDITK